MAITEKLTFAILGNEYVTLKKLQYMDIEVPEGFVFDGVTIKAPFTFIFSNKDLRQGVRASCFHDFMCRNKTQYKRKQASLILADLWKQDGLNPFKVWIVFWCVELYQWCRGWR